MSCKQCFAMVRHDVVCGFEQKGKHGVAVAALRHCNGGDDGSTCFK